MSDSLHGHSSSVLISSTTHPTNGTALGNIISIGGPELSRDGLDISTMDSASKYREFLPGMIDAGEVTIELNYDGTAGGTANLLSEYLASSVNTAIIIRFGDHATPSSESHWDCLGSITALGNAIPFDDKVTQSVTIKLSGVATYTDL